MRFTTYNRAFNQPSSNSLFLDLRSAQDFGGLPFDVWVSGVPDPVNSGVYIGEIKAYALVDANVFYALPFSRSTDVSLSATNLLDNRHREFVGAPELGRLGLLRVRRSF